MVRSCISTSADSPTPTERIIALLPPLPDPHQSCLVMTCCILCLFLPTHTGKHRLSTWLMSRAAHWDYHEIFLFARLSIHNFDDIEWLPHFLFYL
jgi:hypothetical protein